MSSPVDFYFDFSSPYAYFAITKIDELVAEFDRDVVWHPFMLGPAFKMTDNAPLIDQPIKGNYCANDWARLARFMKLPWSMPDPFPIATLAAARAFYWIADEDRALAKTFALACFDTYFGHGEDITAAEKVADIAEPLGIDRAGLLEAVADPVNKQRLKDETQAALDAGVFGSPFFIIDGEPFWGADRLWMVKRWLKAGGW